MLHCVCVLWHVLSILEMYVMIPENRWLPKYREQQFQANNVNDALIDIFLTCGCHICVHTHHKIELKDFESDTILSSRSQTLNILLCLGC